MYSLSRRLRFGALGVAALILAGCASRNVGSFLERGSDFARYRTYTWAPAGTQATGDPRLDNNPFFHERIQAGVEKQLAARGFEKTSTGAADLLIHYHASITQRVEVNHTADENGSCRDGDDCRPYIYEAGSLVIDLMEARTDKLVWRGWSEDSMDGTIDNQQLMEQRIDRAIARILQQLPGRL